jgi:calcineurin-like phosphoesterase family protein
MTFGNIWLASDIHAFHKNICKGSSAWADKSGCRDFANAKEMTETLVKNINDCVAEDDLLIDHGDFSFGGRNNVLDLRKRLNVKNIIHLFGNHTVIRFDSELESLFSWCGDYLEFSVNGQYFVCFHYPIGSWNHMNKRAIHTFGHCHQSYDAKAVGKSFDIDIGRFNEPYSVRDIIDNMEGKEVELVDHHV